MTDLARRTFLGASASLALAPLAAQAAETPPVRVAVIGSGARGSDLIRALSTIDAAAVVGVADDYPPHLEQGLKYAGPQAQGFADYRQMLDKLKPAAIADRAVPLHLHFPISMAALDAGCDLFLEKTMCRTLDEAQRLADRVVELGRVFQIGLQRRSNPIYLQAVAMVRAGMIGHITAIKAQWHRNDNWRRPIPRPKTDPAWAALDRRLNWRLYRDTSAGLMAELGSHQLDIADWFLQTPPLRVIASGGIDYYQDGREVLDNIFCIYDYQLPAADKSGRPILPRAEQTVRVTYSSLGNNAYEGASELILGTHGTLYLTSTKGLLFQGNKTSRASAAALRQNRVARLRSGGHADHGRRRRSKMSNDRLGISRQAGRDRHRREGNERTRDELVSFVDHVARR